MKYKYFIFLAIGLFSLWFITKTWIPSNYAVVGHDSGLSLNAGEFLKSRLYSWDPQGFGRDNSAHFGSLILHFIDYITALISGVLYAGNQLNIFFWLSLIFISSFILAFQLKEKLGKSLAILVPFFITINFYIIQSIFIFERAKYSVLIATILFLSIILRFRDNKINILPAGILSALVLSIFNSGSWLGFPLYGGLIVVVLSVIFYDFIQAILHKEWKLFIKIIQLLIITVIGFIALNFYSIYPYSSLFLSHDISSVTNSGVISQNQEWLDNMSQASSYLNILRFQGVPDWYKNAFETNLAHSYANWYLSNPIVIVLSFLPFVLIIFSVLSIKNEEQRKIVSLFSLILILSTFFMAGSHSPLGFLYTFLYKHIPGFSIFRSPYYKFGGAFLVSSSVLMTFSIVTFVNFLTNKIRLSFKYFIKIILLLLITILWIIFHWVILDPNILFIWQTGYSTKTRIPNYVNDFSQNFNKTEIGDSRILLLPPHNKSWLNDAYTWGYWSLTNLPSLLSNKTFVSNGGLEVEQKKWIDDLYAYIEQGNEEGTLELSKKLGIDYILLRKDVLADSSWSSSTLPERYATTINSFRNINKISTFGEWELYKFSRSETPKFSISNNLIAIPNNYSYLMHEIYPFNDTVITDDPKILSNFIANNTTEHKCQSCPLEENEALRSLPSVMILPNSPLYFIKETKEKKTINEAQGSRAKIDAYLGSTLKRGAEIKYMWDLRLDPRFAIKSSDVMRAYLDGLNKLYMPLYGNDSRYYEASRLRNNLNIVEKSFREIESSGDFNRKNSVYRQSILDILWKIRELKDKFPIMNDKYKLETQKIYLFDSLPKRSDLYIDKYTLPKDEKGAYVKPVNVVLATDNNSSVVSMIDNDDKLIRIQTPSGFSSGKLVLNFNKFPNLLKAIGHSIEQSPSGPRNCYTGSIAQFNRDRKYLIKIEASSRNQELKLFLKDNESVTESSNFIKGQDEVDIFPTLSYQPFYHIYQPSSGATSIKIYICNINLESPIIENIEIHEIISPRIISITRNDISKVDLPSIDYQKINPTKYTVKITNSNGPFILNFNEAYSSLWQIEDLDSFHFKINDYANAWKINKPGTYSIDIVYLPQYKLIKGIFISAISIIVFFLMFFKITNGKNNI